MKFIDRRWVFPGVAVIMLAVGAGVGWLVPPALFNDLAAGWQVWLSMEAGAPFNSVWMPAATDLTRNQAVFQSWWSPGQYLVPAALTRAGWSLGQAVVVAGVLANAAGLVGWWRLWRAWGVTPAVLTASGLVVVLGRAFGAVMGMSNLADVLLFAAVPWAALLAWHWRQLKAWQWLGLFVVLNVGVGLKLAFQVAALAMLAGGVLAEVSASRERGPRAWLGLVLKALGLWLAVKLAWDWGYLQHGASIGPLHGPGFPGLGALLLPWGGPLLAAFSGGNLLGRIFLYPDRRLLPGEADLWPFFLLSVVLTAVILVRLWRTPESRPYARQVAVWLGTYGVVFSGLYMTGASVSLEERHFQVAGLVLLPAALGTIGQIKARPGRWAAQAAVAGFCLYGVASIFVHASYRARVGVLSRHGFMHTELTAGALAELRRLDEAPGGPALFFSTKPEIALEVRRGRAMCIPLDSWDEAFVRRITYEGRAGRLVLVVPEHHVRNGRVEWIKAGLHGYTHWDTTEVDGFFFITGR